MTFTYIYDLLGWTYWAAFNPIKFSTKYDETEGTYGGRDLGLYNYGLRWYGPGMGRFVNRDPSQEDGGLNLYDYCYNDGVNDFDPTGLSPTIISSDTSVDYTSDVKFDVYVTPNGNGPGITSIRIRWQVNLCGCTQATVVQIAKDQTTSLSIYSPFHDSDWHIDYSDKIAAPTNPWPYYPNQYDTTMSQKTQTGFMDDAPFLGGKHIGGGIQNFEVGVICTDGDPSVKGKILGDFQWSAQTTPGTLQGPGAQEIIKQAKKTRGPNYIVPDVTTSIFTPATGPSSNAFLSAIGVSARTPSANFVSIVGGN